MFKLCYLIWNLICTNLPLTEPLINGRKEGLTGKSTKQQKETLIRIVSVATAD